MKEKVALHFGAKRRKSPHSADKRSWLAHKYGEYIQTAGKENGRLTGMERRPDRKCSGDTMDSRRTLDGIHVFLHLCQGCGILYKEKCWKQ